MSDQPPVVWVPAGVPDRHLAALRSAGTVRRLPARGPLPPSLGRGEVVVPWGMDPHPREVFARAEGLRLVQSPSAGVDWLAAWVPAGVTLCDGSGIHDRSVSEWVVAAILATVKRLPLYVAQQERSVWDRHDDFDAVDELGGMTVLIVGHGSIGRATERLLEPFGVEILRVARRRRDGVAGPGELPELVGRADVVVVLMPLTGETEGMIGPRLLAAMRPGALLVNAARGRVVDTAALTDAVLAGRIRAALDVTDPEPLPPAHPLWRAPGVLITPHVAGATPHLAGRAWRFVAEQVARLAAGRPLRNVVRHGY